MKKVKQIVKQNRNSRSGLGRIRTNDLRNISLK